MDDFATNIFKTEVRDTLNKVKKMSYLHKQSRFLRLFDLILGHFPL